MPPIDADQFRRLALILAAGTASACGGSGSSAATTPRHTDPTMGTNGNAAAPVAEGYAASVTTGYCDYATGTYYDPTGEAWWNGGPAGTCYAPTAEGDAVPAGEYYAPVYEG